MLINWQDALLEPEASYSAQHVEDRRRLFHFSLSAASQVMSGDGFNLGQI